jgi:arylsulfatase A-like enzyme
MPGPNLVFVFADQWRAQALSHAGDQNLSTPALDAFAAEGVRFTSAVSNAPVCSPHRATLMTGLYPHLNGMVVNDQCLAASCPGPYLADCLNDAGYRTAYIGKWHIDGRGRRKFVPPERRLGFSWWRGFECNHDYWDAPCYGDSPDPETLPGYESFAQTDMACRFLREEAREPFALFLSWGPPHNPYGTAPEEFRARHRPEDIALRPNVPVATEAAARKDLAGYYAHCEALDHAFGRLLEAIEESRRSRDTIAIFTSDHGDMLGSQGAFRKQRPYEESILVPLIVRDPRRGLGPAEVDAPISTVDLMPTLLGLCGCPVPERCQGRDWTPVIRAGAAPPVDAALLACYSPFHEYTTRGGGRAYRGLRTRRHTYVRFIDGVRHLFDNVADPYQMRDLAAAPESARLLAELEARLSAMLEEARDPFETPAEIFRRWSVRLNKDGDVFYE